MRRAIVAALALALAVGAALVTSDDRDDDGPRPLPEAVDATLAAGFRYESVLELDGEPVPSAERVVGIFQAPDRLRRSILAPGEPPVDIVTIGGEQWTSVDGGQWEHEVQSAGEGDEPAALAWLTGLRDAEADGDGGLRVAGVDVGAVWHGDEVTRVLVQEPDGIRTYTISGHGDVDPILPPATDTGFAQPPVADGDLAVELQVRPVERFDGPGCQPIHELEPATPAVLPLIRAEDEEFPCLLLGPALLSVGTGSHVEMTALGDDFQVLVELDEAAASALDSLAEVHLAERIAIVGLDHVLSAPLVQTTRHGGVLTVPGLTEETALALLGQGSGAG